MCMGPGEGGGWKGWRDIAFGILVSYGGGHDLAANVYRSMPCRWGIMIPLRSVFNFAGSDFSWRNFGARPTIIPWGLSTLLIFLNFLDFKF